MEDKRWVINMQRFSNNRNLSIIDLEESGIYSQELLDSIKHGEYDKLEQLPNEIKVDKDYMEPLLYAVKNDFNTYEVYRYYGENLQNDSKLAAEIILLEPDLLEGTPLSGNKQFIIDNVHSNPDIIRYMSEYLKEDDKLIIELYNMNDSEIMQAIINNCEISNVIVDNPNLSSDKEFMSSVIKLDHTLLQFASEDLRNDYDFLKEESSQNEKIIDYVVDNMDKFGIEGIKGTRDTSKEFTIEDCMQLIDEIAQNGTDKRFNHLKEKIQEKGIDDVHTMRWLTAMVAQRDDISPDMVKKVLNYSMLTMEKNKQELANSEDVDIKLDSMLELIPPRVLNRLKDKVEAQGVEIGEELNERLNNYIHFHERYHEQFNEQKQRNKNIISIEDIENATEGVKASDLKAVIEETEKAIEGEKKINSFEQEKENGENEYER